tara:strand:- start:36 stop:497 length:462 start_codon:yes stop_codon:yes gene_type:complete
MADTSLNENRISILIRQISNLWHSKLRKLLKKYQISINEYLILETIYHLSIVNSSNDITQTLISNESTVDYSVVSIKILSLEKNKYVEKVNSFNSRSNKIEITKLGIDLVLKIINDVQTEEDFLFEKLGVEKINFINTLRLILGKKIRIKVNK